MMKKGLLAIGCLLFAVSMQAQESQEVYSFLRLPVSAHVAALGGDNVSLTNDDATVIFHNPALITNVSDKTLNANFMTYMEGCTTASASFVKAYKERASWGISGQFMSYGEIKETTASNQQTGTFSPKDIALAGSFAYLLSDRISGGITGRLISSTIGSYSLNNWDQAFIKHLAVGADIHLGSSIFISGGYNFRRSSEMKIYEGEDTSSNHGAGLSLGGGIELERFKLTVGYAKYHVSASSLLVNLSYVF